MTRKYVKNPIVKNRGGQPSDLAPVRFVGDVGNSDYSPRQNPLPKPTVGIFDAPYGCVQINQEWLSHILGVVAALLEHDAWQGDDNERHSAHQQIQAMMARLHEDCEDIDMSCCGDLTIELQQIKNNVNNIRNTVINTNVDIDSLVQNYSTIQTTYNNSIDVVIDLAPDLKVPSEIGDKALCAAISEYVDMACDSFIDLTQGAGAAVSVVGLALAVAFAIPTGGASFAMAAGIAAGSLSVGAFLLGSVLPEVYEDQTAREDVKCCLYNFMKGKEPTYATFAGAFEQTACDLGANAFLIKREVQRITSETTHATFLDRIQHLYEYGEIGLLGDCTGCDCGEFEYTYIANSPDPFNFGSAILATDLTHTAYDPTNEVLANGYDDSMVITWLFDCDRSFTDFSTVVLFGNTNIQFNVSVYDAADVQTQLMANANLAFVSPFIYQATWQGSVTNVRKIVMFLNGFGQPPQVGNPKGIRSIVIESNPTP